MNEDIPDKISCVLGILVIEATNKNQEDGPKDGIHLQRLACYSLPHIDIVLRYTFQ